MNITKTECDKATLQIQEVWNHLYDARKALPHDPALWRVLDNLANAQTRITLALNALARVKSQIGG